METPKKTLIDKAIAYAHAGFSVLPTGKNKQPKIKSWTELQDRRIEKIKSFLNSHKKVCK